MSKGFYVWTFQTALYGKLTHYLIVSHLIVLLSLLRICITLSNIFNIPYQSCLRYKNEEWAWVRKALVSKFFLYCEVLCAKMECVLTAASPLYNRAAEEILLRNSFLFQMCDRQTLPQSLNSKDNTCSKAVISWVILLISIPASKKKKTWDINPDLVYLPQYDNRGRTADLKQQEIIGKKQNINVMFTSLLHCSFYINHLQTVVCKFMYKLSRSKISWLINTVHPDYF